MRVKHRRIALALSVATGAAITCTVVNAVAAQAATGCGVTYSIASQWAGGFGANVTVTNLGDPVTSWTLGWTYSAGQTVTQAWNANVTQSGATVTATNVSYNGSLATGANATFGFNGSWTSSNPVPSSFTMNGVTCTGGVTTGPTSASPTPTPTNSPTPTRPDAHHLHPGLRRHPATDLPGQRGEAAGEAQPGPGLGALG